MPVELSIRMLKSAFLVVLLSACFSCIRKKNDHSAGIHSVDSGQLQYCVALRGNGTHVIAHIAGLAALTERWGVVDALAGGSSSTISTFLYESILLNPAIVSRSDDQKSSAVALLLKTIPGYVNTAINSAEWRALKTSYHLTRLVDGKSPIRSAAANSDALLTAIVDVINSQDLVDLVNPEIIERLATASKNPSSESSRRVLEEIRKSIMALVTLDAQSADVFVRPGFLAFDQIVELIGILGDFYAGYNVPETAMNHFLAECSDQATGFEWSDIEKIPLKSGTCGSVFAKIVEQWRNIKGNLKKSSRLAEAPGRGLQTAMITSVVTESKSVSKFKSFKDLYEANQERHLGVTWNEVKFGYWLSQGLPGDVIAKMQKNYPGAKAAKAVSLGANSPWRDILNKSPREPSLGSYTLFSDNDAFPGAISLGGWADLHPVEALKSAGCREVVYLTRRGQESLFITQGRPFGSRAASGIAELLGMGASDFSALFDLDDPQSAYSKAVRTADGVLCTDWNRFSAEQQVDIAKDAWFAPMSVTDRKHHPELAAWPTGLLPGKPKIPGCH